MDGEKVRQARQRAALTLEELSEASGVPRLTIIRIEQKHVKNSFPKTIRALAKALGVKPVDLMSEVGSDATGGH